jgi:hypothetical protein
MAISHASSGDQLHEEETRALLEALDDEYRAHAIYEQVLTDFGAQVLPFANIIESEARHIDALVRLFHRYGIDIPANPWPGNVPRYASVADACRAGAEAEIANAALYERLLSSTTRPDVLVVYQNLQQASQQNHLPAFRRGAERDRGRGGRGRRGRGWRGGRR